MNQHSEIKALYSSTDRPLTDLEALCQKARIQEILEQLDRELVGLKSVQTKLREIIALLLIDQARRGLGLTSNIASLHMCFTGNFGSGMTLVAARMAKILYYLGYLSKGHSVAATWDDLVGQTVNQTIAKSEAVLALAKGGVLLIDGAYFLLKPHGQDLGVEALATLLQPMENQRNCVVILAGDKANYVERLVNSKLGISLSHHIDFPHYTHDELVTIARIILKAQHYHLGLGAEFALRDYLLKRVLVSRLTDIQSIRDVLAQAQLQQANRLLARKNVSQRDLLTIEAEDIQALTDQLFSKHKPVSVG